MLHFLLSNIWNNNQISTEELALDVRIKRLYFLTRYTVLLLCRIIIWSEWYRDASVSGCSRGKCVSIARTSRPGEAGTLRYKPQQHVRPQLVRRALTLYGGKTRQSTGKTKEKKQQACLGNTMIEKLNYGLNVHFIVAQKKINKLKNHKAIAYKINMCIWVSLCRDVMLFCLSLMRKTGLRWKMLHR